MKIEQESLVELKRRLPVGSAQKIRERLLEKGEKFSLQYIYRCLNPDKPDYNHQIIHEAILLGEEMTQSKQTLEVRVSNLRKNNL